MTWALPLAGLLAFGVVGPLIAHLLSRRPPTPRPFPTLRFLYATPTSARRLRTLHDPALWALRTLIVLIIAGAAAGPTLVTARRQAAWQAPILRAHVVGPGLAMPTDDEADTADATRWHYVGRPVRDGLAAALRDLADHSDVPREVVIRWDGGRRALHVADIDAIPAAVGVRLEVVDTPAGPEAAADTGVIEIEAAPGDEAARDYVLADQHWWGSEGVRMVWPRAPTGNEIEGRATAPSAASVELFRRMRLDPRLAEAAQRSRLDAGVQTVADDRLPRARFEPLARSAAGDVLLWGAEAEGRPLLVLDARVRDPLALWSVRVAADARHSVDGWPQPDTQWSDADVQSAQRLPAPARPTPLPGGLDTRWWWLAALLLVLSEGVLRRRMARDAA